MPQGSRSRNTAAQNEALCRFFEENPEILRGYKKTSHGLEVVRKKWIAITPYLNSLGPKKEPKAWAKYLSDVKAKLKHQKVKWKQNKDGTGPIVCNVDELTEIKLRMLQVLRKEPVNLQDSQYINTTSIVVKDDSDGNADWSFPEPETSDSSTCINSHSIETQTIPTKHPQVILSKTEWEDEFDTFGKNIAQQLRTLPLADALETQEILMNIMRKQRMKVLHRTTISDPLDKETK